MLNLNIEIGQRNNWIFDSIYDDYVCNTSHNIVNNNADIYWFINPWALRKTNGINIVSVHHIDEFKLKEWNFDFLNSLTNAFIVPNEITKNTLLKYVSAPIFIFPYWLRTSISPLKEKLSYLEKQKIKKDLNLNNEILIGSFQKDSEGDGFIPKLSKGPDLFLNIIKNINKNFNTKVVLSGYGRKFLIKNLEENKIPYAYFERFSEINKLYSCLDWYFITSRVEGGPQAILEAPVHFVNVLSTNVGMVSQILDKKLICNNDDDFLEKFTNYYKNKSEKNEFENLILNSYKNIVENFHYKKIIKEIDLFFTDLL